MNRALLSVPGGLRLLKIMNYMTGRCALVDVLAPTECFVEYVTSQCVWVVISTVQRAGKIIR